MSAGPAPTSTCPRCGAAFRCGMDAGDAECWCAALPPLANLPPPAPGAAPACFCPDCLRHFADNPAAGESHDTVGRPPRV